MAIINRVSRLFTADVHAVLDRIEEPEVLLRQCIREMEQDLDEGERRIGGLMLEREQLAARNEQCERSCEDIASQLDVCFEAEEADLARGLIRRRLELKRQSEYLHQRLGEVDKALSESRAIMQQNRSRLESMQQKSELFATTTSAAATDDSGGFGRGVSDDEVEVAFLAEKRQRAQS